MIEKKGGAVLSGLFAQMEAFLFTLILGLLTGIIFHYYQLTIRFARLGKYPLYFLDFILWIFMIIIVFVGMLWINQGEMRVYVLIALFVGILIYYYRFASRAEHSLTIAAQGTTKLFSALAKAIKKPLSGAAVYIAKIFKKNGGEPPADNNE